MCVCCCVGKKVGGLTIPIECATYLDGLGICTATSDDAAHSGGVGGEETVYWV